MRLSIEEKWKFDSFRFEEVGGELTRTVRKDKFHCKLACTRKTGSWVALHAT